jgi:mRNA interferase RelE/StbE
VKVIFTTRFSKDLRAIRDRSLKQEISSAIDAMQSASTLEELGDVIKMKGAKNAYRLRLGDYRIGFYFDGDTITLGRFANRKDIYRLFP